MIQPQNTQDVIEEATKLLQLDSAAVFTLKQTDKGCSRWYPSCTTKLLL